MSADSNYFASPKFNIHHTTIADFTVDEIKLIKEQYPVLGISIAPQLPRHHRNAIQCKAKRLGVKRLCCVPDYTLKVSDAIALAMLIDCEGTIGMWPRSGRVLCYNPEIDIYNTSEPLIEWTKSVVHPLSFRFYTDDRGHVIHKKSYQISKRDWEYILAPFCSRSISQSKKRTELRGNWRENVHIIRSTQHKIQQLVQGKISYFICESKILHKIKDTVCLPI